MPTVGTGSFLNIKTVVRFQAKEFSGLIVRGFQRGRNCTGNSGVQFETTPLARKIIS